MGKEIKTYFTQSTLLQTNKRGLKIKIQKDEKNKRVTEKESFFKKKKKLKKRGKIINTERGYRPAHINVHYCS